MLRFFTVAVFTSVAVSACTTPEYDAEFGVCEHDWMKRLPPQFEQRMVNSVRYEQVPDGNITCYGYGYYTHCTQGTKSIAIPYVEAVTADIHEETRDARIESCAASACIARFGNADCETEE